MTETWASPPIRIAERAKRAEFFQLVRFNISGVVVKNVARFFLTRELAERNLGLPKKMG
jgi:hypothetical protein